MTKSINEQVARACGFTATMAGDMCIVDDNGCGRIFQPDASSDSALFALGAYCDKAFRRWTLTWHGPQRKHNDGGSELPQYECVLWDEPDDEFIGAQGETAEHAICNAILSAEEKRNQ